MYADNNYLLCILGESSSPFCVVRFQTVSQKGNNRIITHVECFYSLVPILTRASLGTRLIQAGFLLHGDMAYEMNEAVLAIQEAAKKLNSVSTQICGVEGKQGELLATIKVLSERVTNLEAATNYQACVRVSSEEKKHHPNIPLYERVRLSLLIFVHVFTVYFLWLCSLGICVFPLAHVAFLWL